jgi:hypothetical protein
VASTRKPQSFQVPSPPKSLELCSPKPSGIPSPPACNSAPTTNSRSDDSEISNSDIPRNDPTMDRHTRTWIKTTTLTSPHAMTTTTQPALQPQKRSIEKIQKDWMETIGRIESALDRLGYPRLSTPAPPFLSSSLPSRTLETPRGVAPSLKAPAPTSSSSHLEPRLDGRPTAISPAPSRLNSQPVRPLRPPPLPLLDLKVDDHASPTPTAPSRHNGNFARPAPSYLAPPRLPVPSLPPPFDPETVRRQTAPLPLPLGPQVARRPTATLPAPLLSHYGPQVDAYTTSTPSPPHFNPGLVGYATTTPSATL